MKTASTEDLVAAIRAFNKKIESHLPALEETVDAVIASDSRDINAIEHTLDTLVSLTTAGFGEALFIRLLEYYKTFDPEAAKDHWEFFEELNGDE